MMFVRHSSELSTGKGRSRHGLDQEKHVEQRVTHGTELNLMTRSCRRMRALERGHRRDDPGLADCEWFATQAFHADACSGGSSRRAVFSVTGR